MNDQARLSTLERRINDVESTTAHLEATTNAYMEDRKEHSQTLRNIDDNVKNLNIQFAMNAGERAKETEAQLKPLWQVVRKHDSRFFECGEGIKKDVKKDARAWVLLIAFGITCISGIATYFYDRDNKAITLELKNLHTTMDSINYILKGRNDG